MSLFIVISTFKRNLDAKEDNDRNNKIFSKFLYS